jgi:MFS family permease
MLVSARAVQGMFGALLAPAALSLLTTTFPRSDERSRAFGIYGAIPSISAAAIPVASCRRRSAAWC